MLSHLALPTVELVSGYYFELGLDKIFCRKKINMLLLPLVNVITSAVSRQLTCVRPKACGQVRGPGVHTC